MFTGIIQHVGSVVGLSSSSAGKRLTIDVGPLAPRLAPGASVAIDGACLTVAKLSGTRAEFDAVPETLSRTTLGTLAPGSPVNLEPALTAGGLLDGHIVQGHVDGLAALERIDTAHGHVLHLSAEASMTAQMVAKGSVALAGVSLTLVEVSAGRFSVAIIPTTLAATTLGKARPGQKLNLELDILGKYVRRYLEGVLGTGVTLEKLRQAGFA